MRDEWHQPAFPGADPELSLSNEQEPAVLGWGLGRWEVIVL